MRLLTTFGLSLLLGCASLESAPDITGTVELPPGASRPQTGTLIIEADAVTRASEWLKVESLRIPIEEVEFPYAFRLHGSEGPVGNLAWRAESRIEDDTGKVLLGGAESFQFECDQDRRCNDGAVRILLGTDTPH